MSIEKTYGLATMQLIEQQPGRLRGEQPCEQHESSLTERKLQKSPLSQPPEIDRSEFSALVVCHSRSGPCTVPLRIRPVPTICNAGKR